MKTIKLRLCLIDETPDSTVSELRLAEEHLGYVIEDGHRSPKVWGQTRIPAGTYRLRRRRVGGFYQRYRDRFAHRFVPELENVPGFTWILIHIGNFVRDTAGCLLMVTEYHRERTTGNYYGTGSANAYLALYARLEQWYAAGHEVYLEINRTPCPNEEDATNEPPVADVEPENPEGINEEETAAAPPPSSDDKTDPPAPALPPPSETTAPGCLGFLLRLKKR